MRGVAELCGSPGLLRRQRAPMWMFMVARGIEAACQVSGCTDRGVRLWGTEEGGWEHQWEG